MARKTNWDLFCCLCGTELPYRRLMEQMEGGNLRYIEEEVGLVCKPCLEKQPDAKPPVAHTPPPAVDPRTTRRGPARSRDPGRLRSDYW